MICSDKATSSHFFSMGIADFWSHAKFEAVFEIAPIPCYPQLNHILYVISFLMDFKMV